MALKMQTVGAEGAQADSPAKAPGKGGKLKLPLIIAVVALIAFGVGFAVVKVVMAPKGRASALAVKVGETVPLDEFMINLADPTNDHYLKTTITLGLREGVSADKFKDKVPVTRDTIIMALTSKRLAELRSPAGKLALKRLLKDRLNKQLGEDDIADVYFEAFAMQ